MIEITELIHRVENMKNYFNSEIDLEKEHGRSFALALVNDADVETLKFVFKVLLIIENDAEINKDFRKLCWMG